MAPLQLQLHLAQLMAAKAQEDHAAAERGGPPPPLHDCIYRHYLRQGWGGGQAAWGEAGAAGIRGR